MARIIYQRNRIDPTKISGPYSLLAVMLLVAEILFAIWFYKSQSPIERTIAGSILALVFISLMIFVWRMNRTIDTNKRNRNVHQQLIQFQCARITEFLDKKYIL